MKRFCSSKARAIRFTSTSGAPAPTSHICCSSVYDSLVLLPALSANVVQPQRVISKRLRACKSEFQRHSKEAEIKSAFPPISRKTETQHQEAGDHIQRQPELTHPELPSPRLLRWAPANAFSHRPKFSPRSQFFLF